MFTFANIFFALPDLPNLALILNLDKKVISQKFPNTTFCVPNSDWDLLKLLWEAKKTLMLIFIQKPVSNESIFLD